MAVKLLGGRESGYTAIISSDFIRCYAVLPKGTTQQQPKWRRKLKKDKVTIFRLEHAVERWINMVINYSPLGTLVGFTYTSPAALTKSSADTNKFD